METSETKLANPAPLGLMGFGMTTVILNIHNAGYFKLDDPSILALGIFFGGLAQVVAGIMEFKKGNTFGTTAFTSFGFFWISLVFIIMKGGADPAFLGWYLFMWGLLAFWLWFGTFGKHRAIQVVFASVTILFWLLAIDHWFTMPSFFVRIAGFEGILCGLSAVYLAAAEVLNEDKGRTVLPIGIIKK